MGDRPRQEHVYKNFLMDSGRWARFTPRDDDIVVCTSYKAGTTWTQMICALLIHQSPDLPCPLGELSPWLDMETESIDAVITRLEAQSHRRFIKTHSPLDAIPYFDNVTYLFCGREPRDVFMSMQNHLANADMSQLGALVAQAGGGAPWRPAAAARRPRRSVPTLDDRRSLRLGGGRGALLVALPPRPDFLAPPRRAQHPLPPLRGPEVGSAVVGMRRVAGLLGITVNEATWPILVEAATFSAMKSKADTTAPDTHNHIWLDNAQFFNKGSNEQWRGALSQASLDLYQERSRARFDPDLVEAGWSEGRGPVASPRRGRIGAGHG